MGQTYRIINLTKKESLDPLQTANFSKLMETCYIRNNYILEILHKLASEWHGDCLVYSGDYSNNSETEWDDILFPPTLNLVLSYKKTNYGTELTRNGKIINKMLWDRLLENRVLVNYDQKIYCELDCCKQEKNGLQICPLTLLLANSNGLGSGDYRPHGIEDKKQVGSWQYNRVGLEVKSAEILGKMRKINYNFYE